MPHRGAHGLGGEDDVVVGPGDGHEHEVGVEELLDRHGLRHERIASEVRLRHWILFWLRRHVLHHQDRLVGVDDEVAGVRGRSAHGAGVIDWPAFSVGLGSRRYAGDARAVTEAPRLSCSLPGWPQSATQRPRAFRRAHRVARGDVGVAQVCKPMSCSSRWSQQQDKGLRRDVDAPRCAENAATGFVGVHVGADEGTVVRPWRPPRAGCSRPRWIERTGEGVGSSAANGERGIPRHQAIVLTRGWA